MSEHENTSHSPDAEQHSPSTTVESASSRTSAPAVVGTKADHTDQASDAATRKTAEIRAARTSARRKLGIVAIAAAVGGMAIGGTVEYFVGSAIDATGLFGATIDTVIEQQKANFDDIRAKLDALGAAPAGSPEAAKLQGELQKLIAGQEKLTEQTHTEMRMFQQEISRLKTELLSSRGSVGGADIWLAPRESVTLHERGVVLALVSIHQSGNYVGVTLAGKSHQLKPGDYLTFPRTDGKGECKVIYKIGTVREDGRVGFDLVCE